MKTKIIQKEPKTKNKKERNTDKILTINSETNLGCMRGLRRKRTVRVIKMIKIRSTRTTLKENIKGFCP